GGIGDQGLRSGYSAVADHIRIGELEFEDCVVYVTDKGSVADQDGLIGADVFSAYLVDLDLPGMRLNLAPLPKRPEDTVAPTSLNSEGEEPARAEEKETGSEEPGKKGDNPSPTAARSLPRDRYVAPEMAQWTKVFRFGHMILVETRVNDSKPMLFGLDTGAFSNILSVRAGRQVTKVGSDETLRVRGVDGYVKKVYSADKAILRFGHLEQNNPNIVTLDLSTLSRDMGTEVSGFLGFAMLRLLDVKLDYRDGLVDFVYNPNRVLLIRH
ncbi:MAG TPA: aspartyl protease family protein, partial [Terriglobales bacterium]|nr:aspartyl protease family protein [Terriglobales bacterium]